MRSVALVVAAMLIVPGIGHAQKEPAKQPRPPVQSADEVPPPRKVPAIEGRVYIGDPAPNFVLESATGTQVRLSRLRGDWVVLVFADRGKDLRDLRTIHDDMRKLGARVVGVCREKSYRLKSIAHQDSLPFTLLGDLTGQIAALYGLYDRERSEIQPGFVVIDRYGVVRTAVLGQRLPADRLADIVRVSVTGVQ